jgi:hypothetical protein
MRLGKEQAVGYVEDTEVDPVPAEEVTVGQADGMPLTTAPEPSLPVS